MMTSGHMNLKGKRKGNREVYVVSRFNHAVGMADVRPWID